MHVAYDPLRRVVVFEVNRFLVLLYVQCIEDVAVAVMGDQKVTECNITPFPYFSRENSSFLRYLASAFSWGK